MEDKIYGGATFWARQTIESEIFFNKPDKWFKIWFYLVNKAKWQDEKQFKQGQCFIKYEWIREATGATQAQVKHCVEYLKATSMLATQKATRGFIITICNYSTYQNTDNYKSHTKRNIKGTQKEHKSHTILKKDNNNNKDNKEIYKEKYLDEVFLTKEEYQKLVEKFGESLAKDYIQRLDNYMGSKGVKYASHYKTILVWADKNKPPQQENKPDYLTNRLERK